MILKHACTIDEKRNPWGRASSLRPKVWKKYFTVNDFLRFTYVKVWGKKKGCEAVKLR